MSSLSLPSSNDLRIAVNSRNNDHSSKHELIAPSTDIKDTARPYIPAIVKQTPAGVLVVSAGGSSALTAVATPENLTKSAKLANTDIGFASAVASAVASVARAGASVAVAGATAPLSAARAIRKLVISDSDVSETTQPTPAPREADVPTVQTGSTSKQTVSRPFYRSAPENQQVSDATVAPAPREADVATAQTVTPSKQTVSRPFYRSAPENQQVSDAVVAPLRLSRGELERNPIGVLVLDAVAMASGVEPIAGGFLSNFKDSQKTGEQTSPSTINNSVGTQKHATPNPFDAAQRPMQPAQEVATPSAPFAAQQLNEKKTDGVSESAEHLVALPSLAGPSQHRHACREQLSPVSNGKDL